MSPHLSVRSDYIELMYFSGAKNLKLVESDVEKKFVFEINISKFKGREYIKGFIRELVYDGRTGRGAAESIFANSVARSYAPPVAVNPVSLTTEETEKLIEEKRAECAYGLCLIASDRRTLKFYKNLEGFGCDLFYPSSKNLANNLIVSPSARRGYRRVSRFYLPRYPLRFQYRRFGGQKSIRQSGNLRL